MCVIAANCWCDICFIGAVRKNHKYVDSTEIFKMPVQQSSPVPDLENQNLIRILTCHVPWPRQAMMAMSRTVTVLELPGSMIIACNDGIVSVWIAELSNCIDENVQSFAFTWESVLSLLVKLFLSHVSITTDYYLANVWYKDLLLVVFNHFANCHHKYPIYNSNN